MPKSKPSTQVTRIQAIIDGANKIAGLPYVWGGGHAAAGTPTSGGFDCSGFVCAVLATAGLWKTGSPVPRDDGVITQLQSQGLIQSGEGTGTPSVTLWDNPGSHIFMTINGRDYTDGKFVTHSKSNFQPFHFDPATLQQKVGEQLPAAGSGSSKGTQSGGGSAIASAFATFINLPSTFASAEALAFTGTRSFMADQPLFPFIEQLCQASLRNFMSMPNGNFFAFFPDYFGLFGRKYYWEIHDIEIIHGRIDLSDDPLVTNVAVAGDVTQYHGTIDVFDLLLTSGIFTILDAITTGYIDTTGKHAALLNPTPVVRSKQFQTPFHFTKKVQKADKNSALAFLQKYGARPYVEQAPMIRNPFFEMFLAFQKFMLLWSKQFQTPFEFTFMPEVFPGGLVAFPEHNLQCYVEEVVHSFDYEQGFTTTANLSSPSALPGRDPNVSDGMARPAALRGTPPTSKK